MRRKIMINYVQVLTAAIVLTIVLMTLMTYNMFEERMVDDLRVDARVLATIAGTERAEQIFSELEKELRVTIVAPSGAVIYDNRMEAIRMDSHADRPEIVSAMTHGEGRDIRDSKTLDRSTFYYAMRLESGFVLRVAKESTSIWSVYARAVPLILVLMLAMLAVCALIAERLTRKLLEPVVEMAQHLKEGNKAAVYPEMEPFISMIAHQHEEIIRSANMRVEFTANVSHELKTPLTSISGYAELIESGMAEGEMIGRFAGEIKRNASRLLTLINDTIRLSQMDATSFEVSMESVDLAQIAGQVVSQLQVNAAKMKVSLELETQHAVIEADRQMMEELIYNLCDNAIRYNVRGGSVRVEIRPVRERVMLIVQDTGIGISKENQERVFERFYRVDKSRSKATGGTGLGLAIVKHIAAKHGAQISMDSELGRGTSITVSFDRKGAQMRQEDSDDHI